MDTIKKSERDSLIKCKDIKPKTYNHYFNLINEKCLEANSKILFFEKSIVILLDKL